MWLAWDMAAEMCLLQLPDLLSGEGGAEYQPSPFFRQAPPRLASWLGGMPIDCLTGLSLVALPLGTDRSSCHNCCPALAPPRLLCLQRAADRV